MKEILIGGGLVGVMIAAAAALIHEIGEWCKDCCPNQIDDDD